MTVMYTPTENSQVAMGRAMSSATDDTWSQAPNSVAVEEASISGTPISPPGCGAG